MHYASDTCWVVERILRLSHDLTIAMLWLSLKILLLTNVVGCSSSSLCIKINILLQPSWLMDCSLSLIRDWNIVKGFCSEVHIFVFQTMLELVFWPSQFFYCISVLFVNNNLKAYLQKHRFFRRQAGSHCDHRVILWVLEINNKN